MNKGTTRTTLEQAPMAPWLEVRPGQTDPSPRFHTLVAAAQHLRRDADPVSCTRRLLGLDWDVERMAVCPFCRDARRTLRVTLRRRLRCDAPGRCRKGWSLVSFVRLVLGVDWGLALAALLSVESERRSGGEDL